jgi:hypothetical protein
MKRLVVWLLLGGLIAAAALAQRRWGWRTAGWDVRTAREVPSGSTGTPTWTNAPGFEKDVLTFARIRYDDNGGGRGGWTTDLPDSDLNLSWRLQQLTSLKVDPDGRILRLTDPDLSDYPFIYIVEPGGLWLSEPEVLALRRYLLNGGFLWLDDFWGEREWANCAGVMRRVFPDRDWVELDLDHPLYRAVFQIREKGQVPNVALGIESQWHGVTWERPDAREVHHRVLYDDRGRIMVLATHNTDNGDGWEREGESAYYFEHFSEKTAYPLGINVLVYILTH